MMCRSGIALAAILGIATTLVPAVGDSREPHKHADPQLQFSIRSVKSGRWSNPRTWSLGRVPKAGDRVLVSRGTDVIYDVKSDEVLRLVQVVGSLRFARDRDTLLNVGILKVQNSEKCSEHGFACDFLGVNEKGEPQIPPKGPMPLLEIGSPDNPIPHPYTARVRLHFLSGMNKDDAPAIACCSARMEIHGAPMSRTWVELGDDARPGDKHVILAEAVTGWRKGDQIIVTASKRRGEFFDHRRETDLLSTEERRIVGIDGRKLTLDRPLRFAHAGRGRFTSEVANLSRNVVIESADPGGVRGHTVYHAFSRGSISYARFAHLGKEGVLGRYPIHYHLCGSTMRGSSVIGAAIVDSHNRWVTIHGTEYLVVRDCVGYRSVGHGFFLEDGTEVYNLLDRNLGVQALRGRRLPKQVLPFDPNDGAAFWWANGLNTFVRNVACENDQYGYRYDSQKRSNFDSRLPILMPDGKRRTVDIRTLPIVRFEANETHSEGLYGMAFAGTDGVGPDTRHPHRLKNLSIWEVHYGLRSQLPTMLIEDVVIHRAVYGVYRPWFENHVYRNLEISETSGEPFNRGLDDRSLQHGVITVDGLLFRGFRYSSIPLIQISANNATGKAESHFRNVRIEDRRDGGRRALVNLGGGPRLTPKTPKGVPIYIHDWYGPGVHAKVVSTRAKDLLNDGNRYRPDPPLTGDESVAAKVRDIAFPQLLDPVDDLPPATVILRVRRDGRSLRVSGVSHDNGRISKVIVNGREAGIVARGPGVIDWQVELPIADTRELRAHGVDAAGNIERNAHILPLAATARE